MNNPCPRLGSGDLWTINPCLLCFIHYISPKTVTPTKVPLGDSLQSCFWRVKGHLTLQLWWSPRPIEVADCMHYRDQIYRCCICLFFFVVAVVVCRHPLPHRLWSRTTSLLEISLGQTKLKYEFVLFSLVPTCSLYHHPFFDCLLHA